MLDRPGAMRRAHEPWERSILNFRRLESNLFIELSCIHSPSQRYSKCIEPTFILIRK